MTFCSAILAYSLYPTGLTPFIGAIIGGFGVGFASKKELMGASNYGFVTGFLTSIFVSFLFLLNDTFYFRAILLQIIGFTILGGIGGVLGSWYYHKSAKKGARI